MATEYCQRCKRAHPDRVCDYDDQGECAETREVEDPGATADVAAQGTVQNSR